jgi:hypothetical protein
MVAKSQGQKGEGTPTVQLYFSALNYVFPFFRTNGGENSTR